MDDVLASMGAERARETAALLTSELVTNAVIHADSPVRVAVDQVSEQVQVTVHDDNPHGPELQAPSLFRASGRGLALVEAFASEWGVDRTPDDGKSIWFRLPSGF